jgi:outer membrane autotransporter protein
MGVQYPLDDGQAGISPWVRYFTNKGNLAPEGGGFGSDADFGFEQEDSGTEFGIDFAVGNGFHIGVLGGNADGKQRLSGANGSDRLKLHGAGVYATWFGPRFYVDVSQRWMDFDARLDSPSGERDTSGNATATNIEAGISGWSAHGIAVVPQVQYTRTKIDNVGSIEGSLTQMDIDGGASERGRVGVQLSRTFAGTGGLSWTPYGALSAVREFDGETGFTVADTFRGTTSTDGTSTLAELGLGVHKGHFSATAGFNWSDGGAVDNARGGQVVVRYTW